MNVWSVYEAFHCFSLPKRYLFEWKSRNCSFLSPVAIHFHNDSVAVLKKKPVPLISAKLCIFHCNEQILFHAFIRSELYQQIA